MTARFRAGVVSGVFVALVVGLRLLWSLMESRGIAVTGDEPSYVFMAQALSHGTVHVVPVIQHDLAAHVFPKTYPPGATVANTQHHLGPTGYVSPFEPGLGGLLLPFVVAFGPASGAILGIIALNVAGFVWLHQRVSRLLHLGAVAQLALATAFAAPALLVATNQIYPDLPSGILIGIICVEIAAIELERRVALPSVVVVTATAAYLPWLQPKNLVPDVVLAVGFVMATVWRVGRSRIVILRAVVPFAALLLSAAVFFTYNEHYYGYLLGLHEPSPQLNREALQISLGLLFDKDNGLFVQVPWCVLGLFSLVWLGRRRLSVTAAVAVICFLALLGLNGTYVSNPYGGLSFAGRFMWSLIPICLPWLALLFERARHAGRLLWPFVVVAVGLAIYQGQPIVAGNHNYFNPVAIAYQPYPGWWPGLLHLLPQFARTSRTFGSPASGFVVELAVAAAAMVGAALWARTRSRPGAHFSTSPDAVVRT